MSYRSRTNFRRQRSLAGYVVAKKDGQGYFWALEVYRASNGKVFAAVDHLARCTVFSLKAMAEASRLKFLKEKNLNEFKVYSMKEVAKLVVDADGSGRVFYRAEDKQSQMTPELRADKLLKQADQNEQQAKSYLRLASRLKKQANAILSVKT